jgi:hypothetical protein
MLNIWISDQGLNTPHWGFLGSSKFLPANSGIAPTNWPDHFFPNPLTTHNQHTIRHYTTYSDWKALSLTQEQINSQTYTILVPPAAMSWNSAVSTATSYRVDDQGVGVPVLVGSRIFSSPHRSDWTWGTPNLLFNGYGGGGEVAGAWSWPFTSN